MTGTKICFHYAYNNVNSALSQLLMTTDSLLDNEFDGYFT